MSNRGALIIIASIIVLMVILTVAMIMGIVVIAKMIMTAGAGWLISSKSVLGLRYT